MKVKVTEGAAAVTAGTALQFRVRGTGMARPLVPAKACLFPGGTGRARPLVPAKEVDPGTDIVYNSLNDAVKKDKERIAGAGLCDRP